MPEPVVPEVVIIESGPAPGCFRGYCSACGFLPMVWVGSAYASWDAIGHASAHHA